MHAKRRLAYLALALGVTAAACSDDASPTTTPMLDAGAEAGVAADAGPDTALGTDAGPDAPTGPGITGTVKDQAGVPVAAAKIEVGTVSVFSDPDGNYTIAVGAPGPVAFKVSRPWFMGLEEMVTVEANGLTSHPITLAEIPLKLDPDDAALAAAAAKSATPWFMQAVSIAVAPKPTRRDFDNAVFFHNPALYKDTSGQPMVTPAKVPDVAAGGATNFSFPVTSGAAMGMEALDLTTVVDKLADTGLPETAEFMVWTPMLKWLDEWDQEKTAPLKAVGAAVRQQSWGSAAVRPQEIERVYLDSAHGALWVEVVFASYLQLGPGITDSDGDGRREVFARIAPAHVTAEIIGKLANEYGKTLFTTHGLSKEVAKSLNELYSSTAAQVERTIGQPYEIPGVGTIKYPFVVLRHLGAKKNVILVAP